MEDDTESEKSRFPLWDLTDPNLEYLKRPDFALEEFDQEFPDFEQQGDWELIERPVFIRLLRGYRRLLVKEKHSGEG
jgi:hypothetical protein